MAGKARSPIRVTTAPTIPVAVANIVQVTSAATASQVPRARLARIGEGAEVLIYVKDQKDLFARVCGYFESRNLSILDARIHTTRHGYALDTFLVTDNGHAPHYRELLAQGQILGDQEGARRQERAEHVEQDHAPGIGEPG